MTKNKTLTVPQNGTQPASMLSPIDNMLSGVNTAGATPKASSKRPTSFNIDQELLTRFKADCATKGKTMSSVIEDFILKYVSDREKQ